MNRCVTKGENLRFNGMIVKLMILHKPLQGKNCGKVFIYVYLCTVADFPINLISDIIQSWLKVTSMIILTNTFSPINAYSCN